MTAVFIVIGVLFWRQRQASNREKKGHDAAATNWSSALKKTRDPLLTRLSDSVREIAGGAAWNDQHPVWERLEEVLLAADVGPRPTEHLLELLKADFRETPTAENLKARLRTRMEEALEERTYKEPERNGRPRVTVLVGVNGAGKTTTAGKLAAQAKAEGLSVILGAGDTFRAAAVDQLKAWADRLGIDCILPATGANPAAVAFDAVAAGLSRGVNEVILDTAGRLHTKENLMEELKKVIRVIAKKLPGAPDRILLVLDATLGQNAVAQAKEFCAAIPVTGIVLTKLDGSARGGAVFQITAELGVPIAFAGIGERPEDLQRFSPHEFVRHLLP